MAKSLIVRISGGGEPKMDIEAETIADLKAEYELPNHTASVKGNPVDDDYELSDFDTILLAPGNKNG